MIRIWCAKNQAGHALRRSWMVLALSALMDLRAISNQWHPMTPRRSACSSSRTWRKREALKVMSMGIFYSLHILSCYLMVLLMLEEFIQCDLSPQFPVELLRSASRVEMFPCQNSEGLKELHGGSHKNCHQMNDDSVCSSKVQSKFKRIPTGFRFQVMLPYSGYIRMQLAKNMQVQKEKKWTCIMYPFIMSSRIPWFFSLKLHHVASASLPSNHPHLCSILPPIANGQAQHLILDVCQEITLQ